MGASGKSFRGSIDLLGLLTIKYTSFKKSKYINSSGREVIGGTNVIIYA